MLRRPPWAAGPLIPAIFLASAIAALHAAPHAAAAVRPATIENDVFATDNPVPPSNELRRCEVVLGLPALFSLGEIAACSTKDFAALGDFGPLTITAPPEPAR